MKPAPVAAAYLVVLLACLTRTCLCQSAENVSKLLDDIAFPNPSVRPARDLSTATSIFINFHLMSIISFDNVNQKLTSNVWMSVNWMNDYIKWTPADYEGLASIDPSPELMWRPRLVVRNSLTDILQVGDGHEALLQVSSQGSVTWYLAERFETFCRMDVTFFPFDVQFCRWEILVWAQTIDTMDLHLTQPAIDLDTWTVNGEWNLLTTRAWKTVVISLNGSQFPNLNYEVRLRRRPTLLALTVLLPAIAVSTANVFVFVIPPEAGERLSYSITSLLSFGVFMSFIQSSMPSSSETLSIVTVHLSCLLALSALYVLLCILSLRLFHRDHNKRPVPCKLQSLVLCLEMLLCVPPSTDHKTTTQDIVNMEVEDVEVSGGEDRRYEVAVKEGRLKRRLGWFEGKMKKTGRTSCIQVQDMTWQRVSRTLDKVFFRFFLCLILLSEAGVLLTLLARYGSH